MICCHTLQSLTADLRSLGLVIADLLFVHSSFKSLGSVDGGAGTVVDALEAVLGTEGLLLMPSFNLLNGQDKRMAAWKIESTPSTVGWLTEFFRCLPATHRSDHYSHSVAARGKEAAAFVGDHLNSEGMVSPWDHPPWGKTYGTHSPMVHAYHRGGKLLMLGVDYQSSTYFHLVEVMHWHQMRKENPLVPYPSLDRNKLGAFWDRVGRLNRGKVGHADCRHFSIRDYVDSCLNEVGRYPERYIG